MFLENSIRIDRCLVKISSFNFLSHASGIVIDDLKKLKLTQFYIQNFGFNSSMHNVVKIALSSLYTRSLRVISSSSLLLLLLFRIKDYY